MRGSTQEQGEARGEQVKVTDEMIAAFGEAWERVNQQQGGHEAGARRRAGLEAVLALLPLPDSVDIKISPVGLGGMLQSTWTVRLLVDGNAVLVPELNVSVERVR